MKNLVNMLYDKLYENLSEKRKEEIEKLVNQLKCDYFISNLKDLDALIKANDIIIIETNKILGFWRVRKEKTKGKERKAYIVRKKGTLQKAIQYATAHELGHELLNHNNKRCAFKEEEAHYFAEKLTGINFFNWYLLEKLEFIIDIFKRTPLFLKALYKSEKEILRCDQVIVENLIEAYLK